MMKRKLSERKQSWPNGATSPEFYKVTEKNHE